MRSLFVSPPSADREQWLRPRGKFVGAFAHKRTVRLLIEDSMTVDSLSLIQSLPHFWEDIVGVVPQYGSKCFDVTLRTEESATRLATTGYDYENSKKPLRLLGRKLLMSPASFQSNILTRTS